jgi:hypothetical protein
VFNFFKKRKQVVKWGDGEAGEKPGFGVFTNHQPPTNQLTNDKTWIPELVRNDRELKRSRERVKEKYVIVF